MNAVRDRSDLFTELQARARVHVLLQRGNRGAAEGGPSLAEMPAAAGRPAGNRVHWTTKPAGGMDILLGAPRRTLRYQS